MAITIGLVDTRRGMRFAGVSAREEDMVVMVTEKRMGKAKTAREGGDGRGMGGKEQNKGLCILL